MVPTWIVLGLLEFTILGGVTALLVRHYASKSTPFYALLTVFVAWYLGFFGTLFLPIDIAEAYASVQRQSLNVSELVPWNGTSGGQVVPGQEIGNGTGLVTASPTPWAWQNMTNATALASATANVTLPSSSASVSASASMNATQLPPSASASVSVTASVTSSVSVSASGSASQALPSATSTGTTTMGPTSTGTPTPSTTASVSGTASTTPSVSSSPTKTSTSTARASGASPTPSSTKTRTATPSTTSTSTATATKGTKASSTSTATASEQFARRLRQGGAEDNALSGLERVIDMAAVRPYSARRAQNDVGTSASPWPSGGIVPLPTANATTRPTPVPNSTVVWEIETQELQVRNGPLESMWVFVYWTTFILTYVVIPVVQEYVAAGEFSKKGRLVASIRINLVFYAVCAVVAFGALAYVVFGLGQTLWDLLPVLTSVANTSGLVIIVLLLGYGTAEVPKALWAHADAEAELRRLYFRAPELDSSLFDAKGALGDTVKDIADFGSKLNQMAGDKEFADGAKAAKVKELQRCYAIVLRKVAIARELLGPSFGQPLNKLDAVSAARRKAMEETADDMEEDEKADAGYFASMGKMFSGGSNKYKGINPARLAKLHKKLMERVFKVKKQSFRWDSLVTRCIELEFIVAGQVPPVPVKRKTAEGGTFYVVPSMDAVGAKGAAKGGPAVPRGGVATSSRARKDGVEEGMEALSEKAAGALMSMMLCPNTANGAFNAMLWRFNIYARPVFFKILSVLAEVMSLLLLWSEATIWINLQGLTVTNLSVFGQLLAFADEQGGHSYFAIQFAAAIPLLYMCACVTFSVFRIKLFDMLDLSGGQNTDPYSLLVNASLFNRLQFSLAFNYLNVLMHSNDKKAFPDTAFLHSVGAKMSLSIIDWYLPIFMVVLYVACKLSMFDKMVKHVFGIEDKGDPRKGDRDDEALVREGAIVVARGRRTLGLGGGDSGMSEEDRRKQEDLSRNRIAAVLARAAARRAGQNPDDVARLDDELAVGVGEPGHVDENTPVDGQAGSSAHYATGGGGLSSKQGMFKLDQFSAQSAAAEGGAASSGPLGLGGLGGKLGLADLAKKAKLDKLGAALGVPQTPQKEQAGSSADADDPTGPGRSHGWGSGSSSSAADGPRRTLSSGHTRLGADGSPPPSQPKEYETPPTLAQLLRGKKPGEPTIGPPKHDDIPAGYGLSAQASSRRLASPGAVGFDFQVPGGAGAGAGAYSDPFKTPGKSLKGHGVLR